jgi:hypothetical protein
LNSGSPQQGSGKLNMARIARRLCLWLFVALIAVALVLILAAPVRRKALSAGRAILSVTKAVADGNRVRERSRGNFTNVIFLHHSVGHELIRQGRLRERLAGTGFDFYDHHYNGIGLTRPDGTPAGYSYNIPADNTNPDGLLRIFEQSVHRLPLNALSGLLQHEVILVKSCFIAIQTLNKDDVEKQKTAYLRIRKRMGQYPEKLFIILTSPPANPAETDVGSAARARSLSAWLQSDEFRTGSENLRVFDLFGLLAENNPEAPDYSMLRSKYRTGADSHPNLAANEAIGPILAEFILQAANNFQERKRQSDSSKP